MTDFAEQIEKLTPEQREQMIRGMNEAFAGISAAFREVAVGMQAAFQRIAQQLPPMEADESPGVVWSQLMADIDALTDGGEVSR